MGASESTPTNGTNGEGNPESGGAPGNPESGGGPSRFFKTAAIVTLAAAGVAGTYAMSQRRSDTLETEENENHAMNMNMNSSYLANHHTNYGQPGYESRYDSYPIDRPLMPSGRYKMQTDGSCQPNQGLDGYVPTTPDDPVMKGPSGYGGILRNERGEWAGGFRGFEKESDCLTIEIIAICKGLSFLDEHDHKGSILESDSEPAVNLINKGSYNNKSGVIKGCWNIIMKCRHLSEKNKITISHCSRDDNKCADKLAKVAVEVRVPYMEFIDVPDEIKEIVDRESSIMW